MKLILTHPGGAHKDDFLACCLMIAKYGLVVERREPVEEDLLDEEVIVIDVGGEHTSERMNFDHHQFSRDAVPECALSLVLKYFDLYEDARLFCDWLEPAEWFDTRGPNKTAGWLGVERELLAKLNSPIDVTLLRRFAAKENHQPSEPLWEVMKMIGEDLLEYIMGTRKRLEYIAVHAKVWELEVDSQAAEKAGREMIKVLFMPRTEPLPEDASAGLLRYIDEADSAAGAVAMVYPDRRGSGYGIQRVHDFPRFDFTRVGGEEDVHFAHAAGFLAKTSATSESRLRELIVGAWQ